MATVHLSNLLIFLTSATIPAAASRAALVDTASQTRLTVLQSASEASILKFSLKIRLHSLLSLCSVCVYVCV